MCTEQPSHPPSTLQVWTENAESNEAGGIYLFDSRENAQKYITMHEVCCCACWALLCLLCLTAVRLLRAGRCCSCQGRLLACGGSRRGSA